MDDDERKRIEQRIAGRKMAMEVANQLIGDDIRSRPFMEAMIDQLEAQAGIRQPEPVLPVKHEPIARLGSHVLDYGEFKGRCLDGIPLDRIDWYLRKSKESVKTLGAYMKHPDLESRRGAEIGEHDA